ncbi:LacI family DNA-binding transcriptional regulator [Ruminococcaceae bacterium OttesenSCG-928-L11]|nr:LacI family DNA-binding transcriptional regulator [Ruminococcaceae bacterium OttesenSCG-928-L11]
MKINIKKLSELTGFSQATVSNALNNKRGVNRETAELILKTAKEHGYLTESRIGRIKFVMFSAGENVVTDTPFFSALMDGVVEESRAQEMETLIIRLNRTDPDYEAVRAGLLNDPAAALILLATEMTEEDAAPFRDAMSPVVVLDSWFPELGLNSVLINNEDSAFEATEHLIRCGHREIGYLAGGIRIRNFQSRESGFRKALQRCGCPYQEAFTFLLSPTMDGAYEDMKAALQENRRLPTAFFADNDIIALGAMKALQEAGHRVPEDVSLIGFDDMPFCSISSPPLTTVRVYKQEMGRAAVKRLVELIRGGDTVPIKSQICNDFTVRGSVRAL